MTLWLLLLILPVTFVWIGWPVVARMDTYVGDTFYRVRIAYRKLGGKSTLQKMKTLVYHYIEAVIPKEWLAPLERILTLAGRPGGRSAIDVILMQLGVTIGMVLFGMWAKKTSPILLILLAVAIITTPWRRWLGRIQARRLSASEQIRPLKRRFVSLLRMGTPFEESLRIISREAQGDFGEVFRKRMRDAKTRGIPQALTDLQREFKVQELTRFIQAIRTAEKGSMSALAEIVEKQVRDETAKMDDFIERKKSSVKTRMGIFAAIAFAYMGVFVIYFGYHLLVNYFSHSPIFGF